MRLGRNENCLVTSIEPKTTATGKPGFRVTVLAGEFEYSRFLFADQAQGLTVGSRVTVINRGKDANGYLKLSFRPEV